MESNLVTSFVLTVIIFLVSYSIWNGVKLNLEIGNFYLEYETYPLKRFFKKGE